MFMLEKRCLVAVLVLAMLFVGCAPQREYGGPPGTQPPSQEGPPGENPNGPADGSQQTAPESLEVTLPPTGDVSIYKGFWMPAMGFDDSQQSMSGVTALKDAGANIVAIGPNVKINSVGDVKMDAPLDFLDRRLSELTKRYYSDGIRVCLVIETLYVDDFSEQTPAGGPTAFPEDIASKPGFLDKYNLMVVDVAKLAEKYHVEIFSPMNEPDMKLGGKVASDWGQQVLPLVRKNYSGKVLWKSTPSADRYDINFKGYDIIGIDISPGGGPQSLQTYPQYVGGILDSILSSAERDNVPDVMFTEFGVWGGALSLSEDDKAVAHRIVFEQGKGKVKGFFVLDPPPDLDRSLKGTKTYDEVKLWFKEKL
ncbi:MAG: hypothetical protein V1645_04790 [archaeon]